MDDSRMRCGGDSHSPFITHNRKRRNTKKPEPQPVGERLMHYIHTLNFSTSRLTRDVIRLNSRQPTPHPRTNVMNTGSKEVGSYGEKSRSRFKIKIKIKIQDSIQDSRSRSRIKIKDQDRGSRSRHKIKIKIKDQD